MWSISEFQQKRLQRKIYILMSFYYFCNIFPKFMSLLFLRSCNCKWFAMKFAMFSILQNQQIIFRKSIEKKNFKLTSIVWCDIYKIFASSFCFLTMSLHISIRPKIVANWCNKTLKNLLCYPLRQTEVKLLCELYFYFRF